MQFKSEKENVGFNSSELAKVHYFCGSLLNTMPH